METNNIVASFGGLFPEFLGNCWIELSIGGGDGDIVEGLYHYLFVKSRFHGVSQTLEPFCDVTVLIHSSHWQLLFTNYIKKS